MDHTEKMTTAEVYVNHLNSSLLLLNYKSKEFDVGEIMYKCHNLSASDVWLGIKITSLAAGSPLNIAFFWLLMLSKSALSSYEVLCFNLSLINIVFSLCLPIDIYSTFHRPTEETLSAAEAISVFNLFSCPLLLASMCVERYAAVARPGMHQKMGQSTKRIGFSALVWLFTVITGFVVYFGGIISSIVALSSVIATLLVVGLLALFGLACAMFSKSEPPPAEGDTPPEPKVALKNVLGILFPFAAFYLPFIALDPFLFRLHAKKQLADMTHCHILQVLIAMPNFGVFIGPVLYLPGAIKRVCCTKKEQTDQTD